MLHASDNTLQQAGEFKYLGVLFTTNGKQIKELDTRIRKANVVLRELHRSHKTGVSKHRNASSF